MRHSDAPGLPLAAIMRIAAQAFRYGSIAPRVVVLATMSAAIGVIAVHFDISVDTVPHTVFGFVVGFFLVTLVSMSNQCVRARGGGRWPRPPSRERARQVL